ncbi:MAG: CinY protein [Chloroflexota bacterium]
MSAMRVVATGTAGVLAALVMLTAAPAPPSVQAFGTVNELGQRAEHERITRIALGCAPGTPSDGSCFEPISLENLAGKDGTFGAVGAPDSDAQVLSPAAHCDNGDFLDQPGYPRSRAEATAAIQACVDHFRDEFENGITQAADLLDDEDGNVELHEVVLVPSCTFTGGIPGRAKCNVFQAFGRVLHGTQDFWSHSNFGDESDPTKPIDINNPPGLNLPAPSAILNMRVRGAVNLPKDLATGAFSVPDDCPSPNGRITHACLNKDEELIEPGPGVVANGVPVPGLGSVTDPRNTRNKIKENALKAVGGAVVESRRQWADFRVALGQKYGPKKARLIIGALVTDDPLTQGLQLDIPDAPLVPEIPGLNGAPGAPQGPANPGNLPNPANLPNLPNLPGGPNLPNLPGLPRP